MLVLLVGEEISKSSDCFVEQLLFSGKWKLDDLLS